ncbi:hypothetical protein CH373_08745 [Leptospira perolatii]|uniref:Uncharacterized protein n=2 Tax=Leptospira perolatii TaxID=2023191 RepID=A0A2M9ZNC7_9LEPT|nr:hypothetical protein CH360_09890 [Leptospira perolatii]PJZ73576.1 hypothetical protein CH373_08745 [Leptospira perolatii]
MHIAIVAAPLAFVGAAFALENPKIPSQLPEILLAISLFSVPASFFLRKLLSDRGKSMQPTKKLAAYQTMKIITWALVEGGCFLNAVAFFISGSMISMVAVMILSAFNLLQVPKMEEFTTLYKVDQK